MAKYEDPIVRCPFYSWEEGRQLCCEGVSQTSSITVTFTTKEQRREYERTRCKRTWKDCPLAQALEKKMANYMSRVDIDFDTVDYEEENE